MYMHNEGARAMAVVRILSNSYLSTSLRGWPVRLYETLSLQMNSENNHEEEDREEA